MRLGMSEAHSVLELTRKESELHLPSRNPAMSSLSTSTFGPVAFSLGLLLVMATALPTPRKDLEDDTASNRPTTTPPRQSEKLILDILRKISALKKEMCAKYDKCENSEVLVKNNLNLPKLGENDGCFHSGFNQDTCRRRIISGLLKFQTYLDYLQDNVKGDNEEAEAVQIGTKALIQRLTQRVKNSDEVTTPDPNVSDSLLAKLQSQNGWLKNTTIHLTLESLEVFLQFSKRAILQGSLDN